jgi:uncharacterized RDD family membrane protein YckC
MFDGMCIFVLLVAAFACCYIVVGSASGGHVTSASAALLFNVLALVVPWLYYTIAESSQQQATPGKRLVGLRVVTDAGARISFARANGRFWAKQVSGGLTFGIGYLICAFTPRKQALHDLISGCCVVSVRR